VRRKTLVHIVEGGKVSQSSSARWSSRSGPLNYAIAVLAVTAAIFVGLLLNGYLEIAPYILLFIFAILITSRIGGMGPGLLATGLCLLAAVYLFVFPERPFAPGPQDVLRLGLFASVALFVVWIDAAQQRTVESLRRARDELQEAVQELEHANAALRAENTEKIRAEEIRRKAERELQAIIDTIPAIVARYRDDGSPDYVNQTWRTFTGLTLESLHGQRWSVAIHPDDVPVLDAAWQAHLPTGQAFEIEQRFRRADGEYRWHWVRRVPYRDANGDVVKWYGVGHDIEDQKRAERELQLIIDNIPAIAARYRHDGLLEFVNQTWRTYTGKSLETIDRDRWGAAIHPDDLPGVEAAWRAHLPTGQAFEIEHRLRRADGEYRWHWVRRVPYRDTNGDVVKWYGVAHDIEDQKRAERALLRGRAYQAEAQRLSKTGSFGWRMGSGEISWSRETYRIMGVDHSFKPNIELVMRCVHPEDRAFVRGQLDAAKRGVTDQDYEHRLLMPDGSIKYLHVRAHRQIYANGEEEFVGALMDVTAARQAQDALQIAQAELAHITRVTTLGEMSASIAHEVNQPLAAIAAGAQSSLRWLDRQVPDLDEARIALGQIVKDAHRAAQVIHRIREFSKKAGSEMTELDVNEIAQEAVTLVRHEAFRHGVVTRLELASNRLPVRGDRIQLQQVMINLLVNGMQAMATIRDRERVLIVRTEPYQSDRVLVAIEDVGIGIDPQNTGRLFAAFYTTKQNGLGMGLSICRAIIEAHGGRIWATPRAGPGMTFQFTLLPYASAA
jgi:PAS domain S-box-containing protein